MARKGPGPRQPLSQRRPKAAQQKRVIPAQAGIKRPRSSPAPAGKQRPKSSPAQAGIQRPKSSPPKRGSSVVIGTRGATKTGQGKPKIAPENLRAHASAVYDCLLALYPDAHCELDYQDAFQLLVATILSAQCTDRRVNMVTPVLFARYPEPAALAAARQEDVEEVIRSTGFFRNKARNLIAMANAVIDHHGGRVPASMADLVRLPGVGRKTANVVLGNACGIDEGVVVDTHVQRLSARLGLTSETDPVKIEQVLMDLYERDRWTMLSHLLIWHGRRICEARKPRCGECALNSNCPSAFRI